MKFPNGIKYFEKVDACMIADKFLSCLVNVAAIFNWWFLVVRGVNLLAYDANIYPKEGTMQNKVLNINIYLTNWNSEYFNYF